MRVIEIDGSDWRSVKDFLTALRAAIGARYGTVIPQWRKGRRVSKAVRFCSEKCSKRARRAAA